MSYDFANILFAGPCNQRCPHCIGREVDPMLNHDNLDEFPPRNLGLFLEVLRRHRVREIVFTGTNTDPQLYRHEARLIRRVRRDLAGVRISLHTNGQLALRRMHTVDMYDRSTVSFPSFDPTTFYAMTGTHRMPDLPAIISRARIPVKVSCLLCEHNAGQVGSFIARCHEIGVRRLVLRRPYRRTPTESGSGHTQDLPEPPPGCTFLGAYRDNPVYEYRGMQVTLWDFCRTTCTSLNLFSDGTISSRYLLTRAVPAGDAAPTGDAAPRGLCRS